MPMKMDMGSVAPGGEKEVLKCEKIPRRYINV